MSVALMLLLLFCSGITTAILTLELRFLLLGRCLGRMRGLEAHVVFRACKRAFITRCRMLFENFSTQQG